MIFLVRIDAAGRLLKSDLPHALRPRFDQFQHVVNKWKLSPATLYALHITERDGGEFVLRLFSFTGIEETL